MKKTYKNLYLLYMLFAVSLITANCIAGKVFNTGLSLNGAPITLTVGAICYPITFLITDIIGEIWGKKEAGIAVRYGFICQIVSTIVIILAGLLPAVDGDVQAAYNTVLGQNFVFVVASLIAYTVSQTTDVFIFHKIRDWYTKKHGTTKGGKWLWNNAATMASQLLDSILYVLVAFGFGFKWIFGPETRILLVNMIVGQWLIKVILAAIDTPFFYLFTRNPDKREEATEE